MRRTRRVRAFHAECGCAIYSSQRGHRLKCCTDHPLELDPKTGQLYASEDHPIRIRLLELQQRQAAANRN